MKIFYSWQSDTPARIGKDFIREALAGAASGLQIDDPEDRAEVDQDTQGVLGAPVIADTIFQKIRRAAIVVADVTLTGKTDSGKRLTNSNVAIELGYAIGVHGDGIFVKVMNTHYGSPKKLPFDLAHRRWPTEFSLAPDASEETRQRALSGLIDELRPILQAHIDASRPAPEPFAPVASTFSKGAYWKNGEMLAEFGNENWGDKSVSFGYAAEQPLIYLHVWPHETIPPLSIEVLNDYDKSVIEPLCGTVSGYSHARNRYGRIACSWGGDQQLSSTTQVFESGEIWGVNRYLLLPHAPLPNFIPVVAFERELRRSLLTYVRAARSHFGYPQRIDLRFGLTNVAGFRLALPNSTINKFSGQIYKDVEVLASIDADKQESIDSALLKIFSAVYAAGGETRFN